MFVLSIILLVNLLTVPLLLVFKLVYTVYFLYFDDEENYHYN